MNLRHSVETAALISVHSQHITESPHPITEVSLQQYWERSQRRLKVWISGLVETQRAFASAEEHSVERLWAERIPLLEEIFVSEILTRVWGATLTAADRQQRKQSAGPIALNILKGHTEARTRALSLMVNDSRLTLDNLAGIERLRRKVERWTDVLIGHLVVRYGVDEYAFHAGRAREYGEEQLRQEAESGSEHVWALVFTGLRMAFPPLPTQSHFPNEFLEHQILGTVLGCFPSAAFGADGQFLSQYSARVERSSRQPERLPVELPKPVATPPALLKKEGTLGNGRGISFRDLRKRPL